MLTEQQLREMEMFPHKNQVVPLVEYVMELLDQLEQDRIGRNIIDTISKENQRLAFRYQSALEELLTQDLPNNIIFGIKSVLARRVHDD